MSEISKSRGFMLWTQKKISLQSEKVMRTFKEGEIWWVAVGENIGIEIDGKGNKFSRPVLILHKYSREGFFAIPLTSQKHAGIWYAKFNFKDGVSFAALSQGRTMSVYRLYERIGSIPEKTLGDIRDRFFSIFDKSRGSPV